MRYVLSTGKVVEVWFSHKREQVPIKKLESLYNHAVRTVVRDKEGNVISDEPECPTELKPVSTTCRVKVNGNELISEAKCHRNDTFSRDKGRRIAWNKLTKPADENGIWLQDFLSKEERRELFFKVFPKYDAESYWSHEVSPLNEPEETMQQFHENPNMLQEYETPKWYSDLIRGISNAGKFLKEKVRGK